MPVLKEVEIKRFINLGIKKRYRDNQNLYLETTKAKTGYWEVMRHNAGKRAYCRIGKYPDLSTKDARRLAPTIYDLLAHTDAKHLKSLCGITTDPDRIKQFVTGEVQTIKKIAPSFERYAREWWETNIKPSSLDPITIRQKIQQLESYAFPALGAKPINQVTFEDIRRLIHPMWMRKGERGGNKAGNETARRLLGIIREIFRIALNDRANTLVDVNPTPTARDFPSQKNNDDQHYRSLDYNDAPHFWNWLQNESTSNKITKLATAIVFILGKRQKEVRFLKWGYIDFENAVYNAPGWFYNPEDGRDVHYTKNGDAHSTPIPSRLMAMMEEVREITGANQYALSLHPTKPLSNNTIAKCISSYKPLSNPEMTLNAHGARGTLAQWIEDVARPRQGIVKKLILQHTLDQLEKAYSIDADKRVPVEAERREILQKWENYVMEL
ncbi:MAG: tyrosine-type recombinase/integrase [Alphaproteobacteria bacterium]|nr:tyrosine-type recombinase/integrase [Alphaproteobacteria bacterium]